MIKIESSKENLKEAVETLAGKRREVLELQARKEEISGEDLQGRISEAKRNLETVLQSLVLGKSDQQALECAEKQLEDATRQIQRNQSMLAAVDKVIAKAEREIPVLNDAVKKAQRGIWEGICQNLLGSLTNSGGLDLIHKLHAARIKSDKSITMTPEGIAHSLYNYLCSGKMPGPGQIVEIQGELEREYDIGE